MSANEFFASGPAQTRSNNHNNYNQNQNQNHDPNAQEGERGFFANTAGAVAGGVAAHKLSGGESKLATIAGVVGGAIAAHKLNNEYKEHKYNKYGGGQSGYGHGKGKGIDAGDAAPSRSIQ
ncbi:uncharacterized protein LODBEIA_P33900 [Lodderomyces beijingensis]|uniref:Glycine zipper 2TM domain-containing protein n=1 Tax=Lodderomyces beijingensis TaxID=1775926 RepID=A0ABP0ZQG0_9ASCO